MDHPGKCSWAQERSLEWKEVAKLQEAAGVAVKATDILCEELLVVKPIKEDPFNLGVANGARRSG
jgi:hypothetical protein